VKESAMKKRDKYDKFLSNIKLLQSMDTYERSKIADALKPMKYETGDFVIRQGEDGDSFFFIEEGNAVALKVDAG
jgi:cAMP-dependent protein kinase regulator